MTLHARIYLTKRLWSFVNFCCTSYGVRNILTYNRTNCFVPYNMIVSSHVCISLHLCRYFRFSSKVAKRQTDEEDLYFQELCKEIVPNFYRIPGMGHNLMVVQPRVKWGRQKKRNTTAELQLQETVTLAETLPGWKVVEKHIVPMTNLGKKSLFGKGKLNELKAIAYQNTSITAIFISLNMLTALQNSELEAIFGFPVFDRYQIVLQIFHEHAHTKEAKLQTALAEIPYLKIKLCGFAEFGGRTFGGMQHIGGSGETYLEIRKRLLAERELKLKRALDKIQKQRRFLKENEVRKSFPIVAVVGYTNSGKTTLIKALTKDVGLEPKDQLFATLDVTVHAGLLPSFQKVLFVDTIGFISDIPTLLLQSFKTTLEDVTSADVIVHIRDVSHPDTEAQNDIVMETLKTLELPERLLESMIVVGNKVDLLPRCDVINSKNILLTSATLGFGLKRLTEIIEQKVLLNTDLSIKLFRVPSGGEESRWLYKNAAVKKVIADDKNPNYVLMEIVISNAALLRFRHYYGNFLLTPCIQPTL